MCTTYISDRKICNLNYMFLEVLAISEPFLCECREVTKDVRKLGQSNIGSNTHWPRCLQGDQVKLLFCMISSQIYVLNF